MTIIPQDAILFHTNYWSFSPFNMVLPWMKGGGGDMDSDYTPDLQELGVLVYI
jgi:hypothetical protein